MFYQMVDPVYAMHQYIVAVVAVRTANLYFVPLFANISMIFFFSSGFWFAFICDVEYLH